MKQKDSTTLSDVAEKAGVSKFTASFVLNGSRSNTRVSEATRQRILAAAQDLRYQPNAVARSLSRRSTNTLGFYNGFGIQTRTNFMTEIFTGLQSGCLEVGKDLLLHTVSEQHTVEEVYTELVNGKVDGLVLYSPPNDRLVNLLAASHLPVVAIVDGIPLLPSVVEDHVQGMTQLVNHLYERGHRHIFYRSGEHQTDSVIRRFQILVDLAGSLGIELEVSTILPDYSVEPLPYPNPLKREERALLSRGRENPLTAAMCWTDSWAHSLLNECQSLGLNVPQGLSVAGYSGIIPEMPPRWNLTTVRVPFAEMARVAVLHLAAQLKGEEVPQETVLPVELVIGETT